MFLMTKKTDFIFQTQTTDVIYHEKQHMSFTFSNNRSHFPLQITNVISHVKQQILVSHDKHKFHFFPWQTIYAISYNK